jgi:hypothetical protein
MEQAMRSRVRLENGIIHVECDEGEHDLNEARLSVQRIRALVEETGKPGLLVVHLPSTVEVTAEARRQYMDLLQSPAVQRAAVVGPSAFQRTMANLVIGIFAGTAKCRIVSDLAKALAWLAPGEKIALPRSRTAQASAASVATDGS